MQTTTPTTSRLWGAMAVFCLIPGVGWFVTRRRRRALVVGFLAMLVALPAAAALVGDEPAVLALLLPFLVMAAYLGAASRAIMDRPYAQLDEHERYLRHTILRNPYPTGAGLGLVGGAVLATWGRGEALGSALTLVVLAAVLGLPSFLLAWRLPDDPAADDPALDGVAAGDPAGLG